MIKEIKEKLIFQNRKLLNLIQPCLQDITIDKKRLQVTNFSWMCDRLSVQVSKYFDDYWHESVYNMSRWWDRGSDYNESSRNESVQDSFVSILFYCTRARRQKLKFLTKHHYGEKQKIIFQNPRVLSTIVINSVDLQLLVKFLAKQTTKETNIQYNWNFYIRIAIIRISDIPTDITVWQSLFTWMQFIYRIVIWHPFHNQKDLRRAQNW